METSTGELLISFKEYAESNGTSYANISQNVKRHNKELKGHIKKVRGVKMLDNFAVEFLNGIKRERKNVYAITDNAIIRDNDCLKDENAKLKQELEETKQATQEMQYQYQVSLNELNGKVVALQDRLINANNQQAMMLADLPFWRRKKYKKLLLPGEAPENLATEEAPQNEP